MVRRVGLLVVAMALSACGSTVQVGGQVAISSQDGLAAPRDAAGGVTGPGRAPTAGGSFAGPAAPAGQGPRGSTGSSGSTGAQPAPGVSGVPRGGSVAAGPLGPGVTARSVRIGFQYVEVGAGTAAVLGRDVSIGDPKAQASAVRDWINTHGGLGGRTMLLDTYGVPYADYVSNPQLAFNAVCTHYTQDVKVLAVAVYVPDRTLVDCLAKRDVISVADGYSLGRHEYEQYARYYWSPGSMSQDRGAEVGVAGFADARFLTAGSKIGLLRYDDKTYERAEVSLKAALARRGMKVEQTRTVSYASTAEAERDASAAVIDFNTRGITHVMVLDNSGGIAFAFMQAAEGQQYRPFYALTTNNSPSALQQLAPARQLEKAQAVSWWWGDVGPNNEKNATPPAIPSSRDACLQIFTKAGVDTAGSAQGSALITCDQLLLLKAVLDKASAPNSSAMVAALDRLGTSYSSPLSYGTRFGPGRHDAAYLTRRIRYDADCACWLYVGPGPRA